jgi:DNA-binding GntR family transcriptional regulator
MTTRPLRPASRAKAARTAPAAGDSPRDAERTRRLDDVLPRLRRDIVNGQWSPGQRLPEPRLCELFGVSRTPLRDAFRVLESEGLVQVTPHVGAVVTPATTPALREHFELLCALEQHAAGRTAERAAPPTLRRLVALHRRMQEAARAAHRREYLRLNDQFHRAVVLGAGNAALADAHEHVMWHVHRARHLANALEPFDPHPAGHHQTVVDAILRGDASGAREAMRIHLEEVARRLATPPEVDRPGGSSRR